MGVKFATNLSCDACGAAEDIWMVVTKLNPSVAMYLALPNGWTARTKEFSGELFILCPNCASKKLMLPTPIVLTPEELAEARAVLPKKVKKT